MHFRFIGLMLTMLFMYHVSAQVEDNHVGFLHHIKSQTLRDSLQIQVHLPESYQTSEKQYPTVYLLDGQRFFLYGASLLETYQQYDLTPEFIVVGISTNYPKRFSYFSNKKSDFLTFMKTELIPLIESNYPVSNERLLFGWEYGGSMAFYVLQTDQTLFNGYLLASPFPIFDQIDQMTQLEFDNKSIYFSVSPDEFSVNHGVNKLDSILSTGDVTGLEWTFLKLSEEVHRSTPYPTLYHGIKQYFEYFPELQIDNLDKFLEQGSIEYAIQYNQIRAQAYGFPEELSAWTKFTIIRSAMRANEYDYFIYFSEALKLNEFFPELSNSRISDLADYFARNQGHEEAIQLYQFLLEKYPESVILLTKIGNTMTAAGNEKEAKVYLDKATKISKE